MGKLSNDHLRKFWYMVRVSETEKALIKKNAVTSRARTVSGYLRAMALNRPADEREVFYKILDRLVVISAQLQAAHDCPAKEVAMTAVEDCMLWVMDQK